MDDSQVPDAETEDPILLPGEPINYELPRFMMDVSECFPVRSVDEERAACEDDGVDLDTSEILSGIYYLMASQRLVYIGKSTNIRRRIESHRTAGKVFFTHAFWTPCGEREANDCEMPIIRYLKPHYNKLAGPFTRKDREMLYSYGFI